MRSNYSSTIPDGFRYKTSFLDAELANTLRLRVESLSFQHDYFRGHPLKRGYVQFGCRYVTAARTIRRDVPPIPDDLRAILNRCRSEFEITQEFDQLIITYYRPGAGIGWHCDKPAFDSVIIGISLACPAQLQMRRSGEWHPSYELELEIGSAYVLSGPARWDYEHAIEAVRDTRYSLTFRRVRA